MWKRQQKEIHRFILYNGQDNEETNTSKDLKNIFIKSVFVQDGSPTFEVTGKLVEESNTFVLVNSLGAERRLEVEQKLEFLAILDWTAVIF